MFVKLKVVTKVQNAVRMITSDDWYLGQPEDFRIDTETRPFERVHRTSGSPARARLIRETFSFQFVSTCAAQTVKNQQTTIKSRETEFPATMWCEC